MSGLKEQLYGYGQAQGQVTPDEIDQFVQYAVIHPSVTGNWVGTITSATAIPFVFINPTLDYPRNLLLSLTGVAGGMGGSVTVAGKDQFGQLTNETFGFATANGGGTQAGTKIFASVTAATLTPVGLGGTAVGTASLGVAIGTAANQAWKLGLPTRIASTADVRSVSFSAQAVQTTLNGGTIGAFVNVADSSFSSPTILAGSAVYVFKIKSTYDNSGKPNMTVA